jgi:antitoxin component YwqK of YwqJK toxin-antitoxin module
MINKNNLAEILFPHINDSDTWCRMAQVSKQFYICSNKMLNKKEKIMLEYKWTWSKLPNKQLHGKYKMWYENGQLCYEECYKNGKLHGMKAQWNRCGRLELVNYYANGQLLSTQLYNFS